jgi:hypothetical protein
MPRSRGTYGAPRVHAELRLGLEVQVGRKRVARLMRAAGLQGCHRCRLTRRDPQAAPAPDLVERNLTPPAPDRLWVADITQQRTDQGWLYLAVSSMPSHGGSSAGPWPTTCAPNWSCHHQLPVAWGAGLLDPLEASGCDGYG